WHDPGNTPKGTEFVASIAYSIYHYWKDTANSPIRGKINARRLPFTNFEYTVEPLSLQSPIAKLTPLKLGIVSCYILHNVLRLPNWPGNIEARVWDSTEQSEYALAVGYMKIENSPLRASTNPEPQATGGAADSQLTARADIPVSIPRTKEKPWLACWTTFFNYIIANPNSGSVTQKLRGDWQYDCGQGYQFAIKIYPSAAGLGPYRLTWDQLATTMLTWVDKVSRIEREYLSPQAVKARGIEVVKISIIQPQGDSQQSDGTATA
ncbi:MAG: hypothetical protein Q9181_003621, partial [Wetmoreana brouardii]